MTDRPMLSQPFDAGDFVPWFKARAGKGRNQSMTVLVLADTQAMSLVPALQKIRGLKVVVLPNSAMPAACGHLLDLVSAGDVVHVGDPELSASMKAVGKQMVGGKTFVRRPGYVGYRPRSFERRHVLAIRELVGARARRPRDHRHE